MEKTITDYSQAGEQSYITEYFGNRKGVFLDIGANDGKTFSNSHQLALDGWYGVCIEPTDRAFLALRQLYFHNSKVQCIKCCVGGETKQVEFHEPEDTLVSTTIKDETYKWEKNMGFKFDVKTKQMYDYADLQKLMKYKYFDFITIDTEGVDYDILKQIDLTRTDMLIVEVNERTRKQYIDYCAKYGMSLLKDTNINLIFCR